MKYVGLYLLLISAWIQVQGQEYSYTQYQKKDGLAGSTAYAMVQDKEGFLWIGTETGLSRFDGSKFTNFSTLDGLPDNEVLNLFADSKGRVWIMPFRISICYYYKGKIYNQENDSLLKKLNLRSNVLRITEDTDGNILLVENGPKSTEIKSNGNIVEHTLTDKEIFVAAGARPGKGFWIRSNENYYLLKDSFEQKLFSTPARFSHVNFTDFNGDKTIYRTGLSSASRYDINTGKRDAELFVPQDLIRILFLDDSLMMMTRRTGAFLYNTVNADLVDSFLLGTVVNNFFADSENNWWFCTESKGIFRLNSRLMRTLLLQSRKFENIGVSIIRKHGNRFLFGGSYGYIGELTHSSDGLSVKRLVLPWSVAQSSTTIIDWRNFTGDRLLYGTGDILILMNSDFEVLKTRILISTKCLADETDTTFLHGTHHSVERVLSSSLDSIGTIWEKRPTCLYRWMDTLYIGGLDGIHRLTQKYKKVEALGESFPILKNRIASIQRAADGALWIAMYGAGVVLLKNDRIVNHFTNNNGLNTNVCKSIYIGTTGIWVTTDKGLTKIIQAGENFSFLNLTMSDGLPSDIVNSVYEDSGIVYIGNSKGITYFNDKDLSQGSISKLAITGIKVNNSSFPIDSTDFLLPNNQNNLQFEFAGISFKSMGDMSFRYRLLGQNDEWQTTTATVLNYPGLPSGVYTLQLQAVNKYGKLSELKEIKFEIEKKLIERVWFRLLILLFLSLLSFLVLRYFFRRLRKREDEKRRVAEKIAELEQLALKSQMNPHFVFNSLNSIQHFVMNKDIAGANKFISDFSRLIRLTLDYSSKSTIPVLDEANYLRTYLDLEKNRMEDKFSFEINVAEEIEDGDYLIPPMLLQPYVENSIRHGIRFRTDNKGKVVLSFSKTGSYVECVVEDNGIGRKAAGLYKMSNPIEYQSKGMSLTEARVEYFNRHLEEKVFVLIEDLVDQNLNPLGTRVTLKIPDSIK